MREVAPLVCAREHSPRTDAPAKDDRLYLLHMLGRCRRHTRFIQRARDTFMESDELQDAVILERFLAGEGAGPAPIP